jgi:formyl-CoA transferase
LAAPDGSSWWFKAHNRNKRFVMLDLHAQADRQSVRDLARDADVLLENFRPGRMAAWGLGYDDLYALNPRLVYAAISGYGQDGPYAGRVGFGNIAESMGGLRYISGFADRPPVRPGISLGDELAGLYCVVGILAALRARDRDGEGDFVDVSLFESCINLMQGALPEYAATGVVRERAGNALHATAPSNIYPTKDGRWLAIGANANSIFKRFCSVIGRPDVAADSRFAGNRSRTDNAEELDAIVASWTQTLDCDAAAKLLADAGVPAGPVNSIADIVGDEHVRARGIVVQLPDDAGNMVSTTVPVPRLRRRPAAAGYAARAIGADTTAVLKGASR